MWAKPVLFKVDCITFLELHESAQAAPCPLGSRLEPRSKSPRGRCAPLVCAPLAHCLPRPHRMSPRLSLPAETEFLGVGAPSN